MQRRVQRVMGSLIMGLLQILTMATLRNRCIHYIFALGFLIFFLSSSSSFFLLPLVLSSFSSPNLSGSRLDVYHTSTLGVALV